MTSEPFAVFYDAQGYLLKFEDSYASYYPRITMGRGMLRNLSFKQAPQVSFMHNKPFENYWPTVC